MDMMYGLVGMVVGLVVSRFLPSYFGEKGKNLATKEDIDDITRKIEEVKYSYAAQIEAIRANFSGQLATHGHRYQREFTILEGLSKRLVEVRDYAAALRPVIDFSDPGKSQEEVRSERLTSLWNAQRRLYMLSERTRPFYPAEIYDAVNELERVARKERLFFQSFSPDTHPKGFMAYWDEATEAQSKLKIKADEALGKIRERVAKWDAISMPDAAKPEDEADVVTQGSDEDATGHSSVTPVV